MTSVMNEFRAYMLAVFVVLGEMGATYAHWFAVAVLAILMIEVYRSFIGVRA